MATDATGVPSSPDNIPKYNTAADIPSGKGLNAIVDALQTLFTQLKAGTMASGKIAMAALSASGTPDATTFLRGDGAWAASGGATVATTVAGLGTGTAGKFGLLRAGATPFTFLPLVYDATYGKWISASEKLLYSHEAFSTAITAYNIDSPQDPAIGRRLIPDFKALYDAGLRPQFFLAAILFNSSGANTTFLRLSINDADNSSAGVNLGVSNEISVASATVSRQRSGWVQPAITAPGQTDAIVYPETKVSAGTGTYNQVVSLMRWVSA